MEMDEEFKTNVKKLSTWVRLFYMIFFIIVFNVAELVAPRYCRGKLVFPCSICAPSVSL